MFSSLTLWYRVIWPSECFHEPLANILGNLLIIDQNRREALGSAFRSIRMSPIPWCVQGSIVTYFLIIILYYYYYNTIIKLSNYLLLLPLILFLGVHSPSPFLKFLFLPIVSLFQVFLLPLGSTRISFILQMVSLSLFVRVILPLPLIPGLSPFKSFLSFFSNRYSPLFVFY